MPEAYITIIPILLQHPKNHNILRIGTLKAIEISFTNEFLSLVAVMN